MRLLIVCLPSQHSVHSKCRSCAATSALFEGAPCNPVASQMRHSAGSPIQNCTLNVMRKVCCRARQTETHSCAHKAVLTSMEARLLPPASSTEPEPCWHVVLEPCWQIAGSADSSLSPLPGCCCLASQTQLLSHVTCPLAAPSDDACVSL